MRIRKSILVCMIGGGFCGGLAGTVFGSQWVWGMVFFSGGFITAAISELIGDR